MIKTGFQKLIYTFIAFSLAVTFSISAFAADGDLDTTFGTGGIATYDFDGAPSNTDNDQARDVAVQADGKIVMVGYAYVTSSNNALAIMRFNADGTVDTSFGNNGRIINDYAVGTEQFGGVVIQPDGKIVAVGTVESRKTRIVVRYNADGTTDTAFGTNGIFTAPLAYGGNNVTVDDPRVLLQTDGKILAMGSHKLDPGADIFAVRRLNTDGTLDTSFGDAGLATARFTPFAPNLSDRPSDFALQADGKIVAAGFANAEDVAVARWNADGTLDNTFGASGKVQIDFGADSTAWSVTIQPDGKVLVGGRVLINQSDVLLVRLNTNGTLDTTFDNDGYASADFGMFDHAYKIFVRNNKIITVGVTTLFPAGDFLIARFNMDGSLDTSFGTNGSVKTSINNNDFTYSAAFAPDGKLVIGGYTQFSGVQGQDFAAVRYNFGSDAPNKTAMDFDGDGKADLGVFRPSEGNWYIQQSTDGFKAATFGFNTDKLTPADFDGDGKTDIAVYREGSAGYFYILNSSDNTFRAEQFGTTGDDPSAIGDWDGDGKADVAVYRGGAQSYFYYRSSSQPAVSLQTLAWGTSGDKPMRGDFDGDGKQDAAVYRPSTNNWYILQSSNSQFRAEVWGLSTDKFVPADYDGDGKTDVAVFRNGVWYILQSSNNQPRYETFGASTDALVPADYDGDGKADVAVFRQGAWYILQSSNSGFRAETFGASSDTPLESVFVQ